jgi:hypothetical protein
MSGELVAIVIPVTFFLVIGWSIRTISTNRRLRAVHQAQIEMQQKLLERFGTAPEMRGFLESESGRRFLETTVKETTNPYARMLSAVQSGILITLAGAAFLSTRNLVGQDGADGFTFLGTLGIFVGVGFLTSALAVYFLSRTWGLLPPAAGEKSEG